jgi:hypothetical protein
MDTRTLKTGPPTIDPDRPSFVVSHTWRNTNIRTVSYNLVMPAFEESLHQVPRILGMIWPSWTADR